MMRNTIGALLLLPALWSCNNTTQVFQLLQPSYTGVHFNNLITENDSVNILDLEYVYNGGGVAIADFNNDGLQDLFFTGNMVDNALLLNRGSMQFRDISNESGIKGSGKWCTGVSTIDINQDGFVDIYISASINKNPLQRANILYVNHGPDKNGIPQFKDEAVAYNIADTGYSTNAAFFDYDNDSDLDLFILTNKMAEKDEYPNQYRPVVKDGSSENTSKLYRNDWSDKEGHPIYTDVSKEAGILIEGFGLGVNISDINYDGWKDIYVTNDFLSNDILYINNKNGTFTNRAGEYLKHTSYSAMGNDLADINNDGLVDMITVDMLPESNLRKKMMMSANSYQSYMNNDQYGYQYQYGRNTLQLNLGDRPSTPDSPGSPVFGDIAYFAGTAETDWSWTPMVTDFDNDGFRDIIITNGFPKDITDHDFMTYRVNASKIASKDELLSQIPEVKLSNYAFRNNGDLRFVNTTKEWGMDKPSFSTGAAYGDLDNDGDLDCVISNINDKAFIYRNYTRDNAGDNSNYLQVKFEGSKGNRDGIGTMVEIFYGNDKMQISENSPYRGYISSVQGGLHFGIGEYAKIDSIRIKWTDGKMQVLNEVFANQVLTVKKSDANLVATYKLSNHSKPYFSHLTSGSDTIYNHQEYDFADFNIQKLLPHKLSEYGPGIAAGDINGDGLDDLIIGGSFGYSAKVLFQQSNGRFLRNELLPGASSKSKQTEDLGVLLFDADNDNDLDLYISSGGYENEPNSVSYKDFFFLNNGKGKFEEDSLAIPKNFVSKSCVRACDYDNDGDLDVIVAGRVEPWSYPKPVSSAIYRNDTKQGKVKFVDVTKQVARDLINIGLVCDVLWTDFDNDGWTDLIVVGEWMSIQFLKNDKGRFENISDDSGVKNFLGWWNSIAPGDFDNDGDIDYIVGNLGLNSFYRASTDHPVRMYAKDFDDNGSYDAFASVYLPDINGVKREYPAQTRDDVIKQMVGLRSRFQNYSSYANVTMDKVLSVEDIKDALILEANYLKTSLLKNLGKGKFELVELPPEAQLSMINGIVVEDINKDGNLDLIMSTNDYGTEVTVGRYDALNGLVLMGDGTGNFTTIRSAESGVFIPGNGKAIVQVKSADGKMLLVAGQNRGPIMIFKSMAAFNSIPIKADDRNVMIRYKTGKIRKLEFYYGSSFLSQSSRILSTNSLMESVIITKRNGNTRKIIMEE